MISRDPKSTETLGCRLNLHGYKFKYVLYDLKVTIRNLYYKYIMCTSLCQKIRKIQSNFE